jgi:DNA-binding winged helix-turn-helix (wHTH) protein
MFRSVCCWRSSPALANSCRSGSGAISRPSKRPAPKAGQSVGGKPNRVPTMTRTDAERALKDSNSLPRRANRARPAVSGDVLEFGRFRVLLRRRQLVSDAGPIELGTRAFDLLVVLLEADGSLVTKDELLGHVWPDVFVAEENLKVQISALRRALGEDREFIRTEFGRGYRLTAAVRSTIAGSGHQQPMRRSRHSNQASGSGRRPRLSLTGWLTRNQSPRRFSALP